MSVPTQRGHIAFAYQSAGEIGDGAFTPGSGYTWNKHDAAEVSFAVQDMMGSVGPEIGSGLFERGVYKNGVFLSGSYALQARLQGSLGWLLKAASGKVTETAPVAGTMPRITKFQVDPADDSALGLIAIRKYTPARVNSGTDGQTEYGLDCVIPQLALTFPQMGPVGAEFAFLGRRPIAVDGETSTGNAAEDATGLAMAFNTTVTAAGLASFLPANGAFTGAQVIIANQVASPQQLMVLGKQYPNRFVPLARAAGVRLIYQWQDARLYRELTYGPAASGQRPWRTSVVTSAVSIESKSAANVPTFTNPYALKFTAPSVVWSMSPIVFTPQQLLQVELSGQVIQAAAGTPTWEIDLTNNNATYV